MTGCWGIISMEKIKKWKAEHPDLWEFIIFNILSNCATVTNFTLMFICTKFIFATHRNTAFSFLIFDYRKEESLMLAGFLSFLIATAAAQAVNFYVQKNFVFKSNADFKSAIPKYIVLAVILVIISAALPAHSMRFFRNTGMGEVLSSTLANIVNIAVQVAISYPAMKYLILPKK